MTILLLGRGSVRDPNLRHAVVGLDVLHDVGAPGDLPEYRMDTIEVARVAFVEDDEELASASVLARMRHRERAELVFVRIARRLAIDLVARSPRADAAVAFGQIAR